MKKLTASLILFLSLAAVSAAQTPQNSNAPQDAQTSRSPTQNSNMSAPEASAPNANAAKPKRGPIFRATKDQIMQAQTMLKTRGMYEGDATGKLDPPTRAALKKYQEAEGLRVTGTLNRVTLEKMAIELTERQRAM